MGKFTMIADMGQRLVELLQDGLVPDVIQNPEEIGLRSPEEKGDVSLGIFLYDVRQSEEIYQRGHIITKEQIFRAPVYLSLFYMITAYSNGDVKYRLAQEERILGKVIQILYDTPVIPLEQVDPQMTSGTEIHIQMQKMTPDEKSRIWNFPNVGNRLSLFYKVSPVTIDSGIGTGVTRVTDLDVNVSSIAEER